MLIAIKRRLDSALSRETLPAKDSSGVISDFIKYFTLNSTKVTIEYKEGLLTCQYNNISFVVDHMNLAKEKYNGDWRLGDDIDLASAVSFLHVECKLIHFADLGRARKGGPNPIRTAFSMYEGQTNEQQMTIDWKGK